MGQTEAASAGKRRVAGAGGGAGRRGDEAALLGALERVGAEAVTGARAIMAWARERGLREVYGEGQLPSWTPVVAAEGGRLYPISVWGDGMLAVNFQYLVGKPRLGDEAARRALLRRLNELGYGLTEAGLTRRPGVKAEVWALPERVEGLLAVLDDLLAGRFDEAAEVAHAGEPT
jgi:hypothetical protein